MNDSSRNMIDSSASEISWRSSLSPKHGHFEKQTSIHTSGSWIGLMSREFVATFKILKAPRQIFMLNESVNSMLSLLANDSDSFVSHSAQLRLHL